MGYLDPDQAVVVVVVWSLFYATLLGPWLSMKRLLAMLPTFGPDLLLALVDGANALTPKERKEVTEAVQAVVGLTGPDGAMAGGMPRLKPMKWWEALFFMRGLQGQSGGADTATGLPPTGPQAAQGGRSPAGAARGSDGDRRSALRAAFRGR